MSRFIVAFSHRWRLKQHTHYMHHYPGRDKRLDRNWRAPASRLDCCHWNSLWWSAICIKCPGSVWFINYVHRQFRFLIGEVYGANYHDMVSGVQDEIYHHFYYYNNNNYYYYHYHYYYWYYYYDYYQLLLLSLLSLLRISPLLLSS